MRFKPRHYVLILLIVALGAWNFWRTAHRHAPASRQPGAVPVQSTPLPPPPPETGAAWTSFDKVAGLRDAPESQFAPALAAFHTSVEAVRPQTSAADLHGCQTWLEFYRQGVNHPSRDTSWKTRSGEHLDSCVQTHHDVSR